MINDILGKLVADKYRIESLVSESESADIYLGRHEVLDTPVTVKILPLASAVDGRWVTRFVDQARAASALSHPNILNVTDFGTDAKGISYAVFEEAKGKTLGSFIADEPQIDEKRSLNIARQIAAAVAAAHAKKIIHGGLAPQFIYVDDSDEVKVYGFGASVLHVAGDADPRYLSPEQCTAFPAADERSDVYSLGVILYEMLSGVVPYDGATAAGILAKQNAEPPPLLSAFRRDLHADIEPIVLTAIAADPERRYPNMAACADALELLSGSAKAQVKAAAGDAPQRNIWQTAFIVLAGISLLAVSLIYLTSVKKTDPTTQLVADAGSLPVQPIGPATGAQEESLAKLPAMTDAEIMAATMTQTPDMVPGGDGYNAWANGGAPPAGAPLNQGIPPVGYVPPGGQYYTVDPNGSQFMPPDSGVILVPVPANTNTAVKPTPTPKTPGANTAVQPTPVPNATPKPMATPPPKGDKPATTQPQKDKTPTTGKPAKNGKPGDPE
ncbi:MAG: protein kinase [Pyrinomonadaceae bacterium]